MSDIVWFAIVFVGFFVLRFIAATAFFYFLLPADGRCPNCDAVTIRVQSPWWNRTLPMFRTSWCYECGWHGLLRGSVDAPSPTAPPRPKPPAMLPHD